MEIEYIIKRDYSTKTFHLEKITGAIQKAMNAVGTGTEQMLKMLPYRFIKP